MAKITIKLHGAEVFELKLESGQEYIAGRAPDCAIQLQSEKGISRHHVKFTERDGVWVAESMAKFMPLHKGGQAVDVVELSEALVFMVPPYEFHFEPILSQMTDKENAGPSDEKSGGSSPNLPAFYTPRVGTPPSQGGVKVDDTGGGARVNNDATVAGVSNLVPYFRISYPNTADDEVLKLEGQLWVAGRDPGSEIPIDSPHISRKHFELVRTKEGFFITDLGSSNGTKLNGNRIPPHEPTRLDSGDELKVMNVVMLFEIRDTHFSNRVDNFPVPTFDPVLQAPPQMWQPQYDNMPTEYRGERGLEELPEDWKRLRPHHLKKVDWKKNKVRMALIILIPLVLVMAALPDKKETEAGAGRAPDGTTSVVFANLTPEQKAVVKDSFNLARNLYVQGKYELCLTELAKVHELIPQHENSKELQSFCEQGRELVKRQRDLEYKERERAMIEQQITGYVETCKAKLNTKSTVDETRQCLGEAMELDPEHHLITEMIHTAQMHEEERKFLANQKAEVNKKALSGEAHYQRVKAVYKAGKLAKAVDEYEKFLNSSYPRIESRKEQARREVASIKKELKSKVDTAMTECRSWGAKQKYKEAWLACKKALDEDPKNNEAKEYQEQMLTDLRREMKNIYEDSVLEESLGNVDSAKEKWRRIMKEDLDFNDYHVKSKSKLQKYGGN